MFGSGSEYEWLVEVEEWSLLLFVWVRKKFSVVSEGRGVL